MNNMHRSLVGALMLAPGISLAAFTFPFPGTGGGSDSGSAPAQAGTALMVCSQPQANGTGSSSCSSSGTNGSSCSSSTAPIPSLVEIMETGANVDPDTAANLKDLTGTLCMEAREVIEDLGGKCDFSASGDKLFFSCVLP